MSNFWPRGLFRNKMVMLFLNRPKIRRRCRHATEPAQNDPHPLCLIWVLLLGTFLLAFYQSQRAFLNQEIATAKLTAHHYIDDILAHEAERLESISSILTVDHTIQEALRNEDIEELQRKANEILTSGPEQMEIIHVHFYGPDRKALVEHHHAARQGEQTGSLLLQQAAHNGRAAYGLDLDILNTLTFWMTYPCYDHHHDLLGYLQLGEHFSFNQPIATSDTTGDSHRTLLFDSVILLNKKFLDRDKWESGMRLAGAEPRWDLLPETVIANTSFSPDRLAAAVTFLQTFSGNTTMTALSGRSYQTTVHPILDSRQRLVGNIVLFTDVDDSIRAIRQGLVWVVIVAVLLGALLFSHLRHSGKG